MLVLTNFQLSLPKLLPFSLLESWTQLRFENVFYNITLIYIIFPTSQAYKICGEF